MFIKKILLYNFRNYINQEIELDKDINVFFGNNAQGKTNILESIYLCAFGKSFRVKKDKDLIMFNKENSFVEIYYKKDDREGKIKVNLDDKKVFYINDVKQEKISNIVGKINVVMFNPDDINIIKGDSSKRRKFIDMMICSLKPKYLNLLTNYNKILKQRNNYLKQIKIENKNIDLLDVYDEQLAEYSEEIYNYRKYFFEKFENKLQIIHNMITKSGKEKIEIKYLNSIFNKNDFLEKIKKNRKNDIIRGFTSIGIHRDDFIINVDNKNIQVYGSQGQKKSAILSLKICELEIVKEELDETPVLLLDDFMSELDEIRRNNFLENIKDCQIIITATDDVNINIDYTKFNVIEGKCIRKEKKEGI